MVKDKTEELGPIRQKVKDQKRFGMFREPTSTNGEVIKYTTNGEPEINRGGRPQGIFTPLYDEALCTMKNLIEILEELQLKRDNKPMRWVIYGTPGKNEKCNKDNGE